MKHMLKISLVALLATAAASCSGGDGPTNTTTKPSLQVTNPTVESVGYDSAVITWNVIPRPAKGQLDCPGEDPVSSGSFSQSHRVVQKSLELGTTYNCTVSVWEDTEPAVRAPVSFRTLLDPCVDPAASTARVEFEYTFPPEVRSHQMIVEVVGYICESSNPWDKEFAHVPPPPSRTVRLQWDMVANHPFGSADHMFCILRGDLYVLQGQDFTLRAVEGSGQAVHLTRVAVRQPFSQLAPMDCWKFRLSRDSVYP